MSPFDRRFASKGFDPMAQDKALALAAQPGLQVAITAGTPRGSGVQNREARCRIISLHGREPAWRVLANAGRFRTLTAIQCI